MPNPFMACAFLFMARAFPARRALSPLSLSPLVLLALALLAPALPPFPSPLKAQGAWQPAGPGGGSIVALVHQPAAAETLWAALSPRGVYWTTDGGLTWSPRDEGLPSAGVLSLEEDPIQPLRLFAGLPGGVYRTNDGGALWTPALEGLDPGQSYRLALDPFAPENLYAGGSRGSAFKSTNSGATWLETSTGLPAGQGILDLAVDPALTARLYAAVRSFGIFRSTNSGTSWEQKVEGLPSLSVLTIVADPLRSGTAYVGLAGSGVAVTSDGGGSWGPVGSGLPEGDAISLALFPTTPATIWAGIRDTGLFRSTDGGEGWSAVEELAGYTPQALSTVAGDPGSLWCGMASDGAFLITEGGTSVESRSGGLPGGDLASVGVGAGALFVGTAAGENHILRSTDAGRTWTLARRGIPSHADVPVIVPAPTARALVYAGTGSGVHASSTQGDLWSARTGGEASPVAAIAVDPSDSLTLLASGLSVRRSTDGGLTWSPADSGLVGQVVSLTYHPVRSDTVYAGGKPVAGLGGGAFRSVDAGRHWAPISTGLFPSETVRALAIDPLSPGRLFAGTLHGIYRSVSAGAVWEPRNGGLPPNLPIASLAIDPAFPETLFCASTGVGVYRTTDGGGNWAAWNEGLTDLRVVALAIDAAGRRLYAATSGGGLFSQDLAPVGTESGSPAGPPGGPPVPAAAALLPNYPNPFNPSTTIPFVVPAPETEPPGHFAHPGGVPGAGNQPPPIRVTLQIYDLRGRLLRTLLNTPLSPGRHEAVWDGREAHGHLAPSGPYLIRLQVEGGAPTGRKVWLVR